MSDRNIAPRTDGITSQGIFLGVAECKYEMPSSPTPLLGERVRVRAKSMLHKSI